MGWKISQKNGKYRIWSTISDAWLTKWIDRKEVIKFYHEQDLLDLKKKTIERYLAFPHFYSDRNSIISKFIVDTKRADNYSAWMEELTHKRGEEYYAFIDETYDKIMKELEETGGTN